MEPITIGIIVCVIMLVMLLSGVHIAVSMGLAGIIGFAWLAGWEPAISLAASQAYSVCSDYSYSVIPLFMLMGLVIFNSGIAKDLYDAMNRWFGRLPGGLLVATTIAGAFFGAASGSSIAAAVTFAKISVPEMIRLKYHGGLACGSVAAIGTLSAMIPPSGLMVLYAIITEQSIGKCLLAGFIPGILTAFMYCLAVLAIAKWKPELLPKGPSFTMKEKMASMKRVGAVPLIGVVVLGGLFFGFFTPTEAAAVGAFTAIIFAAIRMGVKKMQFMKAVTETLGPTVMIFIILVGAFIFSSFLAASQLPVAMADIVTNSGLHRMTVLTLILAIFFILGMFMSSTAMVVIMLPVVFPIIANLGFEPIWFGVIIIKMTEIGVITPPVGLNVYAVKSAVGDVVTMEDIFKGIAPFLIMEIITLAILVMFPILSMLIPNMMRG